MPKGSPSRSAIAGPSTSVQTVPPRPRRRASAAPPCSTPGIRSFRFHPQRGLRCRGRRVEDRERHLAGPGQGPRQPVPPPLPRGAGPRPSPRALEFHGRRPSGPTPASSTPFLGGHQGPFTGASGVPAPRPLHSQELRAQPHPAAETVWPKARRPGRRSSPSSTRLAVRSMSCPSVSTSASSPTDAAPATRSLSAFGCPDDDVWMTMSPEDQPERDETADLSRLRRGPLRPVFASSAPPMRAGRRPTSGRITGCGVSLEAASARRLGAVTPASRSNSRSIPIMAEAPSLDPDDLPDIGPGRNNRPDNASRRSSLRKTATSALST